MGKSVLEQDNWELSRKTLVSILTESHYSPGEFADSLGSQSCGSTVAVTSGYVLSETFSV